MQNKIRIHYNLSICILSNFFQAEAYLKSQDFSLKIKVCIIKDKVYSLYA